MGPEKNNWKKKFLAPCVPVLVCMYEKSQYHIVANVMTMSFKKASARTTLAAFIQATVETECLPDAAAYADLVLQGKHLNPIGGLCMKQAIGNLGNKTPTFCAGVRPINTTVSR